MLNRICDITIEQIIKIKINFINHNDIFDEKEYKFYNEGEILAYEEMLEDIHDCLIDEFVGKYTNILKNIQFRIEGCGENEQREKMVGYNNAIVSVIELIDPKYKYINI